MKKKDISFWIEEAYALYSSRPLVEKYYNKNYRIWVYTQKNMEDLVSKYFADLNIEVILIEQKRNIYLKVLSKLFTMPFINRNFSVMYSNDLDQHNSFIYNFINKIFPFKINKRNINNYYFNTMRIFNKFRFKGDFVIAFTFVHEPYLFANSRTKVIFIMESWDHIVKRPHLIKPSYFMTWNEDLKLDAKIYQNYRHMNYIYPLKLRYIEKFSAMDYNNILKYISNESYLKDLKRINNKDVILYPVSYTSVDNYERHLDQLKFIKSLISVFSDSNFIFFIKPKPTGPIGDYDSLLGEKNVIIGEYTPSLNKEDMLKDEYHAYRYLLLKKSKLVINAGTTFGLDAALADTPVLQLNITEKYFGTYAKSTKNPHIEKYLLRSSLVSNFTGQEKIVMNETTISKGKKYSQELKSWCLNNPGI